MLIIQITNVIIITASILKRMKVKIQIKDTTTMSPITLILRKMISIPFYIKRMYSIYFQSLMK